MKDANTNWRTAADGALTSTETTDGIFLGPAPVKGHGAVVHVPEHDDDADTLDVTFEESDAEAGTYREFAALPQITGADSPGDYEVRLANRQPWVRAVLTVAGTTPDYGEVHAGLDDGAHPNDNQQGFNL